MDKQRFELRSDHVALIREMTISDHEWCIEVDRKRPFGNSDIVESMAGILEIDPVPTDDGETHWPPGTRDTCKQIFEELATALQVVLASGSFEPGLYEADQYSRNWRKL